MAEPLEVGPTFQRDSNINAANKIVEGTRYRARPAIYGLHMKMKWTDYDPEWLAVLAEAQVPGEPWLPDAIRLCTRHSAESKAYYHFVSPENANQPGADWQFEKNIILQDPKEGMIVLDILKGHRVGGVEFVDRL